MSYYKKNNGCLFISVNTCFYWPNESIGTSDYFVCWYQPHWNTIITYYQATSEIQTYFHWFLCVTMGWCLDKSLVNILSWIYFARNGLLVASTISENSILGKQFYDSIYLRDLAFKIWQFNVLIDDRLILASL